MKREIKGDSKIKKAFDNQAFNLDMDKLWVDVESQLPEKKRRFPLLWFSLIGLMILGTSSTYFIFNQEGQSVEQKSIASNTALLETTITNSIINDIETKEITETEVISSTSRISNEKQENTRKELRPTESNTTTASALMATSIETSNTRITTDILKTETTVRNEKDPISYASKTIVTGLKGEEKNKELGINLTPALSRIILSLTNHLPSLVTDKLEIEGKENHLNLTKQLNYNSYYKPALSLYFQSGVGSSITSWKALTPEKMDFVKDWSSKEKPLVQFNSELGVRLQGKSGFYASAGLMYMKEVSRIKLSKTKVNSEPSGQPGEIYVVDFVDTLFSGASQKTVTNQYDAQWHTEHTRVDWTLKLGYIKQMARWSIGSELGIYGNAFYQTKGIVPMDDFTGLTKIDSDNEHDYYVKNIGLSYYGGLELGYSFNSRWSIYAKPYIMYNPNNRMNNNFEVERKTQNFGLFLGTQFDL